MVSTLVAAVGDILIDRAEPVSALREVRPVLNAADVAIGNFEGVLSDSSPVTPGGALATIVPTSQAAGLAGFDVLSLANNHALDAGYPGLHDSLDTICAHGIATVGAGRSLPEAWRPSLARVNGATVAVVAVSSVLKAGWEAKGHLGGIAGLRATDQWLPRFYGVYSPGIPPRVASIADESDWERLAGTIAAARSTADVVVVSIHWGDHTRPWVITDFERTTAHRLASLGVDLVLGHHQHYLRGVELIGRTPVFYGLGHIVFDNPRFPEELRMTGAAWQNLSDDQLHERLGTYAIYPRADDHGFPFHELGRWTVAAVVEIGSGGPPTVGFVPYHLDPEGSPLQVRRDDGRWPQMLEILHRCQTETSEDLVLADAGRTVGGAAVIDVRRATR